MMRLVVSAVFSLVAPLDGPVVYLKAGETTVVTSSVSSLTP